MTIHSAHVATYGERAVDTFYLTDLIGDKIEGAALLKTIERRLLEAAAGHATEGLPAAMETFLVLEDLGRLSRECRVSLDNVVPGNIDAGERFASMPVELRVHGPFHRLLRFLARIESGEHPVRVARLSLSRPAEGTDMSLEAGLAVCCLSPGSTASAEATP